MAEASASLDFDNHDDAMHYLRNKSSVKVQFLRSTRAVGIDPDSPDAEAEVSTFTGFSQGISGGDTGRPGIPPTIGVYANLVCSGDKTPNHGQDKECVAMWAIKNRDMRPRIRFVSDAEYARGVKEQEQDSIPAPAKASK